MLVVMAVQLGISWPEYEEIQRNFNFITNAALGGISLVRSCSNHRHTVLMTLNHPPGCVAAGAARFHLFTHPFAYFRHMSAFQADHHGGRLPNDLAASP